MPVPTIFAFLLASLISPICGASKPHVLFIAVDDLNDYISPLANHPGVLTPNFERLARQSVTFANAHCAAPACHPSRVAVMTGVHPVKSGLYRNLFGAHGPRWRRESPVLADAVVLSKHFSNHGYHSAGAGKIFHTLQWTPGDSQNDPEAWDEYRGDPLDPISADWPRPEFKHHQNHGFTGRRPLSHHLFGAAALPQREDSYGDHLIVDWAIEKLRTTPTQPQFIAVGLFRPHIPFEVPRKYFDLHPLDEIRLPEHLDNDLEDARPADRLAWHQWVIDNEQWKPLMQGYLASISYLDHQLGRLLDALDASPSKDDTIVVLWSDHGFHIGEKSNWEKFALWHQTTNTPLFIQVPGGRMAGRKCHQPVTLTDLYPTLCELAGLPTPGQCTGTSLVPLLNDPDHEGPTPSLTSFVFNRDLETREPSHALSDDRYRYISYPDGFEELYDLQSDPHEFTNLAGLPDHKDRILKFRKHLPAKPAPCRLRPADDSKEPAGPDLAGKPFRLKVKAIPDATAPDGVMISHGGDHHGYSLYLQNGLIHFSVRRNKVMETVIVPDFRPEKPFVVSASLDPKGRMTLSLPELDGSAKARGNKTGFISSVPNEPRTLNADPRSPVGSYQSPFPFKGTVELLEFHVSAEFKDEPTDE
ncbi:MAG: sulfatase [Akkermansiaceae bacterium]